LFGGMKLGMKLPVKHPTALVASVATAANKERVRVDVGKGTTSY